MDGREIRASAEQEASASFFVRGGFRPLVSHDPAPKGIHQSYREKRSKDVNHTSNIEDRIPNREDKPDLIR